MRKSLLVGALVVCAVMVFSSSVVLAADNWLGTWKPNADTAAPKKTDDNGFENVWKKDGKVTITAKAAVSKDGKTLTISQTGKNAKGETVNATSVFEKQ